MNLLYIKYRELLVGEISYDTSSDNYIFSYDKDWIKNGFEISPALSFQGFDENAIKLFIENLLPEGKGLEELSIYFQISKNNKFAMLKQIGLDTTGALTLSSEKTILYQKNKTTKIESLFLNV